MKQKENYVVAIVGATGAVGQEMIAVLEERQFPVERIVPLASTRSLGKSVTFNGKDIAVDVLTNASFKGVDIALFSAGGEISKEYAPVAAQAGCLVIDNSSAFRMEKDIPLVVPEVNADACADWRGKGIIANPNCSTIQLCVALKPLQEAAGLERVVVSTYQAVSGAGTQAMDELADQVRQLFNGEDPQGKIFPQCIAFNCIPRIDDFLENGYTKEEWKVVEETRKILGDPSLPVSCTAVRVPVFVGHSEAVHVETTTPLTAEQATTVLREAPGVVLVDDPKKNEYPLARDVAGTDPVYVGRVRKDSAFENGIALWVVADNLRKGAATNAVQIAEVVTGRFV